MNQRKFYLFVALLGFLSPSFVWAQALCPEAIQTNDNGALREYVYQANPLESELSDRFGPNDGHHAVYLDTALVGDAGELDFNEWEVSVVPFYLPSSCEGLSLSERKSCVESLIPSFPNNDQVTRLWYGGYESFFTIEILPALRWTSISELPPFELPESILIPITGDTFLPGPFDQTGSCQWQATDLLARDQKINYRNFMLWDWDDFCPANQEQMEDWIAYEMLGVSPDCDEYGCVTARGCADGVRVYVSSGSSFFDDHMTSFIVLRSDLGNQVIDDDGVRLWISNNRGPNHSAATLVAMMGTAY